MPMSFHEDPFDLALCKDIVRDVDGCRRIFPASVKRKMGNDF